MKSLLIAFIFASQSTWALSVLLKGNASDEVKFGYVNYNLSASQNLEVVNTSNEPVTIDSIDTLGFGFSTRHQCTKTLLPLEKCEVNVAFWNVNPGPALGSLNIKTSLAEKTIQLKAVGGADPFDLNLTR